MKKNLIFFLLLFLFTLTPVWIYAQTDQSQGVDPQEVIEKAGYLKNLINNLLLTPNVSSIQEAIQNAQDEKIKSLIHKAMETKVLGEKLFEEKRYFEALVDFQTSLECILQAIRESQSPAEEEWKVKLRLEEKLRTNEYFISTASRILTEDNNHTPESRELLGMARAARTKAEAKINEGKAKEALEELENSLLLAKRAIISARQGKVIERKSPGAPDAEGHP